jgi:DinB superfamily
MTIDPDEAPEYFFRYIELVETDDVCAALVQQQSSFLDGLRRVTDETASHRYDHDKWSIRQVLAHLNDCERLFLFRAFWFARGFESPLPGFDQNIAAAHDGSERRRWDDLVEEFHHLRGSTVRFFNDLPGDAWLRRGVVEGHSFTVRALACIIVGHVIHHAAILEDRYHWSQLTARGSDAIRRPN